MLVVVVGIPFSATRALQPATPAQEWRSLSTPHFEVHFPRDLGEWTRHTAEQLESIHAAVTRLIGYAPRERVTVLVDDPLNVSNGYAMPGPHIFLFPTPPEPRSDIGENRGWGELLAIHEFAHIAHMTRPSRNSTTAFLNSLLPVRIDPILMAPRWVLEGYATYVEGKLTGSGRPHGLWRPTVLREMAVSGTLPSYAALNSAEGFYAGSMAYLAGSAFLEWLARKEGEESLVSLWRRMTARISRDFGTAFAGVYGSSPAEMYARFSAEVTAQSLAVEKLVEGAGRQEGELFQRFSFNTGDPSLSASGKEMVLAVKSRLVPPRIVVYSTTDDTLSDLAKRAAERARQRDPEDVPAVVRLPRPHRQLAVLESPAGKRWDAPRFTRDGSRILLTRVEGLGNGTVRTDLFEWRWKQNSLRRITHGAGIRHPDHSPTGNWAAATQCIAGFCSVVRVSLADGLITTLAPGSLQRNFYRPRVSPDGNIIVASMNETGSSSWQLVSIHVQSGAVTPLAIGDRFSRFDAEFTPDGKSVVATSTTGGIFNLEIIDLNAATTRRITNVVGGVFAPAVTPAGDSVYFLSLRAHGYDVRRASLNSAAAIPLIADENLAPIIATPGITVPPFTRAPIAGDRAYLFGAQRPLWIPVGGGDAAGAYGGGLLSFSDPVGRLSSVMTAVAGSADSWRGGSLSSTWRGWPIHISASAQIAGKQFSLADTPGNTTVDLRYRGIQVDASRTFDFIDRRLSLALGGWIGQSGDATDMTSRRVAFAAISAGATRQSGVRSAAGSVNANFEVGQTGAHDWRRFTALLRTDVRTLGPDLSLSGNYVRMFSPDAGGEQIILAGGPSPLLDVRHSANLVPSPLLSKAVLPGSELIRARAELSGVLPFTAFAEWNWPRGGTAHYFVTSGLSFSVNVERTPQLAVPDLTVELGSGAVVAGPYSRRLAVFGHLRIRP